MRMPGTCSVCGLSTKYTCVDCIIDKGERIFVCAKPECRSEHRKNCTAPTDNSAYKYAYNHAIHT